METTEQKFFENFGIKPKMLCGCEFKNLHDFRVAYGSDVCIHLGENENEEHCSKCELAEQKYPLYPPITDETLLELLVLMTSYTNYIKELKDTKDLKEFVLKKLLGLKDLKYVRGRIQDIFMKY